MDTHRPAHDMPQPASDYRPQPAPMPESASAMDNMLIDIPLLWSVFRRRLGLFLGGLVTIVALVVIITFQMTPKFAASATVVIDPRQKQVLDYSAMISGLPADSATVDTEVQIIGSRAIAQRVTEKLDLYSDPEFNPAVAEETGKSGGFLSGLNPFNGAGEADDSTEGKVRGALRSALLHILHALAWVSLMLLADEIWGDAARLWTVLGFVISSGLLTVVMQRRFGLPS